MGRMTIGYLGLLSHGCLPTCLSQWQPTGALNVTNTAATTLLLPVDWMDGGKRSSFGILLQYFLALRLSTSNNEEVVYRRH